MEAEGGDGGTTRKEHTNDDNTIRTRPNLTQSQKMRAITEDACDHGRCMRSQFIQDSSNQTVSVRRRSRKRSFRATRESQADSSMRHTPRQARPGAQQTAGLHTPRLSARRPGECHAKRSLGQMVRGSVGNNHVGRSMLSQGLCVASEFNRRYESKGSHWVVRGNHGRFRCADRGLGSNV